jgi:penicillin-binding protein 1A
MPYPEPPERPGDSLNGADRSAHASTPWWTRLFLWILAAGAAVCGFILLIVFVFTAVAYPSLPDVSELLDYRPKLPLRIYSAQGTLIGEFGEERRNFVPAKNIPKVMKDAVLAIEDANFYSHGGIDYKGVLRAGFANLSASRSQGASTITMQVARNVYLSSERTYSRKLFEMLLTFKLERTLTKDQILEIYMNQIYLGQRAYGFAAAAETYFGKSLAQLSIAEAAMLAGLPKAPSSYNPVVNPTRARTRQQYIIDRMLENEFITQEQAAKAKAEVLTIKTSADFIKVHADYVAEQARQLVYAQYGEHTYTRGLNVYTSIDDNEQNAAYASLRQGIMDYDRRQSYRGPEKFIDLPKSAKEAEEAMDDAFAEHSDNGDLRAAIVLSASTKKVTAQMQNGDIVEITGDGLKRAQVGLSDNAPNNVRLRPGALIRIVKSAKGTWDITQLPEVEGAFVALDPRTGSVKAMVGGFDFGKNKFNHVTQAWRQPGSTFKPFIYSAALEKGFTPTTIINDAELFFSATQTGGQAWEPKNYDGTFDGPMTMRTALAKSKNMVSIRILQNIGPQTAQDWITRFGFDASKHPPYLTIALGAGSVTPMQMASAYAVFANGGHFLKPTLVTKVTDQRDRPLVITPMPVLDDSNQVIEPRNAFLTSSLLQEVTTRGTAARASAALKRTDIYGKTGTTNDAIDAWFAGFHHNLVGVVWMGFDTPKNLGSRETGGGLSLPVWIRFMDVALKNVPVVELTPPSGITRVGNEWYFEEFTPGRGVRSLGLQEELPDPNAGALTVAPTTEEKRSILDLFKN